MQEYIDILMQILLRFVDLVSAPITDQQMLWTAVPLVIATVFMTLYFGKYRKEELGWATAFGNTMVFLFISIGIIQYMYHSGDGSSWDNLFSNSFYLTITLILTGVALLFMFVTYYHLLPKKLAFFLFSAPPVNVSVYILMTIVYTGVPADYITLAAAILLFLVIFLILKLIQKVEEAAGHPEGLFAPSEKPKKKKKKQKSEVEIEEEEEE